jgi:RNA polymerase sigma-70 factor (ECF subfamily)
MHRSLVWMDTMRTAVSAWPATVWEAVLSTEDQADSTERFLRLAATELDRAYRLAGLLLGSRSEAEEATQEALLRAWRNLAALRDPDGFQAWFDRILVNICRDRLRRRARIRFIALDEGVAPKPAGDPFRSVLDRDEALRALATLDADERLVVILHYWADLTLASIAERTGWPLGTVKSRLHRALARLGARLDRDAAMAGEPPS